MCLIFVVVAFVVVGSGVGDRVVVGVLGVFSLFDVLLLWFLLLCVFRRSFFCMRRFVVCVGHIVDVVFVFERLVVDICVVGDACHRRCCCAFVV